MSENLRDRVESLREQIRRHDRLYYVEAAPEITDQQYDRLFRELRDIEAQHPELVTPDSPTQRVGGEPVEGFATVQHAVPMLSVDNTYSAEELRAFDARVARALDGQVYRYTAEPKIDGVAVSLRYEAGSLVLAATRGDGRRGDDITHNVRRIRSVPLRLTGQGWPDVLEVRGEIYWPRTAFAAWNAARAQADQKTFANPRNGTAGTLKSLDPAVVADRGLAFLAHGFGQWSHPVAETASDARALLHEWALPTPEFFRVCDDIDAVLSAVDDWARQRNQADYETDGLVVKVDRFDQRLDLGTTTRAPRWCIAYKYQAERKWTRLESVSFQVGRLGTITPVAHLQPVILSGTTVSNASLHNFDQIQRLDVRVGDTVLVAKAGEIIPQVIQVDFDARSDDATPIAPPDACPSCGGPASREEGAVALRCVNPECPAQLRQRLEFFAGRDQMDIDHLGPALIDQLVESGRVKHFADLYSLEPEELAQLDRMGEKSARNVVDAIQASLDRGLSRVLAGLGIRHVGSRAAQALARAFGDMETLLGATRQQIEAVDEIGPVIAGSVVEALHSQAGRETVAKLAEAGVKLSEDVLEQPAEGPLVGKTVVVTGTLERLSRKRAQEAIVAAGGKASSSVSARTDYLVAGASPGSKLEKARSLGVRVLNEDEFSKLLSGQEL